MKLGWLVVLGLAAAGGYYYWHKHQPVTQLTPGSKYQLTGAQVPIVAASGIPGWVGTSITMNTDGTAVMVGTYNGQAIPVPVGIVATPG